MGTGTGKKKRRVGGRRRVAGYGENDRDQVGDDKRN